MINLRDSYIKVDWDPSRRDLFVPLWGKVNDTGRGLVVTIYQKGLAVVATTETLRINWEKTDGTEGYVEAIPEGGKFYVEELDQMFSIPGIVKADLQLQVGAEFIKSDTFKVPVVPSIADQALLSSSDFTALQDALGQIASVESQLAETMNKTAITLNHIFADNTARDSYFITNPLEKINLTFIKVGTAYQQLINGVWTAANPILVEAVNQIDDTSTAINKTLSASKELELLTLKANKAQPAWIPPTLLNGSQTVVGNEVKYMKDEMGIVHLIGRMLNASSGLIIFVLSAGYRPIYDYNAFIVPTQTGTIPVTVRKNGEVIIGANFTGWISLAPISFKGDF